MLSNMCNMSVWDQCRFRASYEGDGLLSRRNDSL